MTQPTPTKLFPLWGVLLLLVGCEQAEPQVEEEEEVAVLPGTETSKDFGAYVVHFNALTTDQLTPEIASQYGIVRSNDRAMLSVSILKKRDGQVGMPVPGSVSTTAINLTGQLKEIGMREIREGDAIYYIGETIITDSETLIYTIDVTPINDPSRYTVRFKRQFFVD